MGAAQLQRIALGLMQVARAARPGSRNPSLLETAAENFDEHQDLTGDLQVQRLALGLMPNSPEGLSDRKRFPAS